MAYITHVSQCGLYV